MRQHFFSITLNTFLSDTRVNGEYYTMGAMGTRHREF